MRTLKIRRPAFLCICLLVGVLIFASEARYGRIKKAGEVKLPDVSVSGTITERSQSNGYIVIYLDHIKFTGQSAEIITQKTKEYLNFYWRQQGIVCFFDASKYSYSQFYLGDRIELSGELSTFNIATNPGEFDMCKYYQGRGYGLSLRKPVLISRRGKGNPLKEKLFKLKEEAGRSLYKYMLTSDAGVMNAILFADKSGLTGEDKTLFKEGGILHILSISGLHISLLGEIISLLTMCIYLPLKVEKRFGKYRCLLAAFIILMYGYMLGFHPSVARAVIMTVVGMIARCIGRSEDRLTSLVVAALISLIIFPCLSMDAGFRLSYMAIIAMDTVGAAFMDYHESKPPAWQRLLSTTSITACTMPLIMNTYYQIPVYAPLANLLVLPCMSILVISGFGVAIFDRLLPIASKIFAYLSTAILFSIRLVCNICARLPFNTFITGHRTLIRMIVFYLVLIGTALAVVAFRRKIWIRKRLIKNCIQKGRASTHKNLEKENINSQRIASNIKWLEKTNLILNCLWIGIYIFMLVFILIPPGQSDRQMYLDVGQGDGIACLSHKGLVLIDGGSSSKKKIGEYILSPYIKYMGKRHIDMWFLSHADSDHTSGFLEVLSDEDIVIEGVAIPKALADSFSQIQAACIERAIPLYMLEAGDSVRVDDMTFNCIWPENKRYADENSASMVLMLEREGDNRHTLFMADAGSLAEGAVVEYMDARGIEYVDIYKCAHHGSAIDTNDYDFLTRIRPKQTLISCGKENIYGHPHKETLEYLESVESGVRRTDLEGSIEIR